MRRALIFGCFLLSASVVSAAPPVYRCVGFEDPVSHSPVHANRGRVLPFRAELKNAAGANMDSTNLKPSPLIQVTFVAHNGKESDRADQVKARDFGEGHSFVFDKEHGHWKFDLQTDDFKDDGTYRVTIVPGDASYQIDPRCKVEFLLHGGDD